MGRWKRVAKVLGAAKHYGGNEIKKLIIMYGCSQHATVTGTCCKVILFHLPMDSLNQCFKNRTYSWECGMKRFVVKVLGAVKLNERIIGIKII